MKAAATCGGASPAEACRVSGARGLRRGTEAETEADAVVAEAEAAAESVGEVAESAADFVSALDSASFDSGLLLPGI